MHTDPLALAAFQGPLASEGVLLFVIVLTALLILMIYAVVRAPAWQPTRPPERRGPGAGRPAGAAAPSPRPGPGIRRVPPCPRPRPDGTQQPAPRRRSAAAAAVAPVPHPAEPDPPVLERPVVTGRPPWGPAPRPPGVI